MTHLNNLNNRISSHPLPEDREEMICLWQTTFQDSDEFVNLFFNRVFKSENTLVIKNGSKIVSALQMIPYEIKIGGDIIPSAYVCGVCTLTSERGKGYMRTLMNEAADDMRQKGYGISTIIPAYPWLFDVYKKFGYIHPINYCLEYYSRENNHEHTEKTDTDYTYTKHHHKDFRETIPHRLKDFSDYTIIPYSGKYFSFFDKKQRRRQSTVLHDKYDLENIICDLIHDYGNAWISLYKDKPVGIAFVSPLSEDHIIIKEILYDNTQVKEALIYHILNTYNTKIARVIVPDSNFSVDYKNQNTQSSPINRKTYQYGLACVLDKQITNIDDLFMSLMLD